jgi:predicted nucleic acid-binding protein
MAKIFLDTNTFIDIVEKRDAKLLSQISSNPLFLSAYSIPVWFYVYKHSVPNPKFEELFNAFNIVDTTRDIISRSLIGPTEDLEDNIQLHSASDLGCDFFLTKDKVLLKLGYFGKVRICDSL